MIFDVSYDGFYAVPTNLDDSAKDILAVAQNRHKIEDCFRIMKTNFDARSVYLRKPERIRVHFLICCTALLIYRLIECKLDDNQTHVTASNLIKTLQNMNVVNVDNIFYKSVIQPVLGGTRYGTMPFAIRHGFCPGAFLRRTLAPQCIVFVTNIRYIKPTLKKIAYNRLLNGFTD